MSDPAPLFSVIIPTHARPESVARAAASALECGHAAEVIVVEDRTDCATNIASALSADPARLKHIRNTKGPFGASATRNLGAQKARGQFLVFLDDDDVFVPGYLDHLTDRLRHPQSRWGFADQIKVDETGNQTPQRQKSQKTNPFERRLAALSAGFWIDRQVFFDVGGLDEQQTVDEDTDLCCRLLGAGYEPTYLPMAAVLLARDSGTPRLTNSTRAHEIAACYHRTYTKNIAACSRLAGAERYLLLRAHRMHCRNRDFEAAAEIARHSSRWSTRIAAKMQEWKYRALSGSQ